MNSLTKIEAVNAAGDVLSLELADYSNGLLLEGVDGLDPVKASLSGSGYAGKDGALFQSSKREIRSLSIFIAFAQNFVTTKAPDLRATLYAYFMPKTAVTIRFYMGEELTVTALCRVEKTSSNMFSRNPGAKIDLVAFDPDFLDLEETSDGYATVEDTDQETIAYQGTTETGFRIDVSVDRELDQITFYLTNPDGTLRSLDVTYDMIAGDILTINTIRGDKRVEILRSGISTPILYAMSVQSSWLELFPGENLIRGYAIGDAILYTVTYTARYGGL